PSPASAVPHHGRYSSARGRPGGMGRNDNVTPSNTPPVTTVPPSAQTAAGPKEEAGGVTGSRSTGPSPEGATSHAPRPAGPPRPPSGGLARPGGRARPARRRPFAGGGRPPRGRGGQPLPLLAFPGVPDPGLLVRPDGDQEGAVRHEGQRPGRPPRPGQSQPLL